MESTQNKENASFESVWLLIQENSKQLKETRAILDEKFKETGKICRNLSNKLKESELRYGKFVEALVECKLVDMLNEKGILVNMTSSRTKRKYCLWCSCFYSTRFRSTEICCQKGLTYNQSTW